MLGSITPLGERGRGSRWWLTTSAYVVGSIVGGAAMGALVGVLGAVVFISLGLGSRLLVLGIAIVAGLLLDAGAFGLQLGTGVVTIVTTSLVYATWLAGALTADVPAAVAIGLVFGLARALPVFGVARVHRSDQLLRVDAVLARLAEPSRRIAVAAGSAVACVVLVGAVRW